MFWRNPRLADSLREEGAAAVFARLLACLPACLLACFLACLLAACLLAAAETTRTRWGMKGGGRLGADVVVPTPRGARLVISSLSGVPNHPVATS